MTKFKCILYVYNFSFTTDWWKHLIDTNKQLLIDMYLS